VPCPTAACSGKSPKTIPKGGKKLVYMHIFQWCRKTVNVYHHNIIRLIQEFLPTNNDQIYELYEWNIFGEKAKKRVKCCQPHNHTVYTHRHILYTICLTPDHKTREETKYIHMYMFEKYIQFIYRESQSYHSKASTCSCIK